MKPMAPEEILAKLAGHPGWRQEDQWLALDLQFSDFKGAWQFMAHVAEAAEARDHHPNWYNVYNTVQIRLSTHDAQGITARDFDLAATIDLYLASVAHTTLPPTPIFKSV